MPEFAFTELLPLGPDTTPYRLLSTDGVSTIDTPAGTFLQVDPAAITLLTEHAMRDIAHLLRPGHLQQLRTVLDDPEASDNDRFVALDLLKNANIAAGGVLPMCQDTGTAIVFGKKGQRVWVEGDEEEALSYGNPAFKRGKTLFVILDRYKGEAEFRRSHAKRAREDAIVAPMPLARGERAR